MITFEPLRKYLKETKHNFMWLHETAGIGRNTCSSLNNDKNISLEIIERICIKLNLKVQDVMQYIDDETGLPLSPSVPEPPAKTFAELEQERKEEKEKKDFLKRSAMSDVERYKIADPDFSPLLDLVGIILMTKEEKQSLGLYRNFFYKMRKGSKPKFETILRISKFINKPVKLLYIDKKYPDDFKDMDYEWNKAMLEKKDD